MKENNIQGQPQIVIAYGLNNIGCDQQGATFQTVVGASSQNEHEEQTKEDDPLIRFVFNDDERAKVKKGLQACKDTKDLAELANTLYMNEILTFEVLRSGGFHRTILPILKFETTVEAIKQAIYKKIPK